MKDHTKSGDRFSNINIYRMPMQIYSGKGYDKKYEWWICLVINNINWSMQYITICTEITNFPTEASNQDFTCHLQLENAF
jgi:hypothetical protein